MTLSKIFRNTIQNTDLYQRLYRIRRDFKNRQLVAIEAKRLSCQAAQCSSIGQIYHLLLGSSIFKTNQKRVEILGLLQLLEKLNPQAICEIGTQKAGTLFLFAQTIQKTAMIVSVDLSYPSGMHHSSLKHLGKHEQTLTFIEGDSHDQKTLGKVIRLARKRYFDFLFIDGDHTYEGVKKDFEMYSPLVRKGGIIAFHDIVPDFGQRYGIKTKSYAGGVPRFWEDLKSIDLKTIEFIEKSDQDGFGIGVVNKT